MIRNYTNKIILGASSALLLAVMISGCSKPVDKTPQADPKAFDSAPAELKTQWDAIQAAAATNGYASAIFGCRALLKDPQLGTEQRNTVVATQTQLQQKLFDAAKLGDAAANADLNALRNAPR